MRVTHLVTADHRRGAEIAAGHLVDALDHHGTGQRLLALWAGDERSGKLDVDAVLVPGGPRRGRSAVPRAVVALRQELAAHPADVVLAHGALAALVAAAATTGRRQPPFVWQRILHLPDLDTWHPRQLLLRFVVSRAAGVVALTRTTADEVRRLGFRGPVWHVPNHRPLGEYARHDRDDAARWLRAELGVPDRAPLVGFVGHLVPQKQPDAAVEALAHVRRAVPAARLVVVGDGPRRPSVEARAAASDVEGAVHLLGHRDDVPRILAGLDALLLPSRSESMPGVVVEAQLAGCPVVAFPVDGIADVLEPDGSGVVTARAHPDDAAIEIVALLRDEERRRAMSDRAREHAVRLSTEVVAGRYLGLLATVARKGDGVRILHVMPNLGVGGAEQAVAVLARHIDQRDAVQVVVAVGGARRPLVETVHDDLQALGVPLCDLGVGASATRSVRGLLLATSRLRRVALRFGADVVDAALLDASLPARLAPGRWARVTHLVNTPWEPVVRKATGARRWRTVVARFIDRWSSRRDDALVALSGPVEAAARRDLALAPGDRRLVVVPRGVDVDTFRPSDAPRTPTGTLEVVSVGRLVPQKAHDVLVRAVAELVNRDVDVRLRIAGEGPCEHELRSLIDSLALDGTVELIGPVRDVPALLRSADVFALASRWEGLPNAMLEAMACGLPVVASDIPQTREAGGDAAVLVPTGDVDAFADALVALAADRARRDRLGEAARTRVVERYAAADRAADLLAVWRRVARRR